MRILVTIGLLVWLGAAASPAQPGARSFTLSGILLNGVTNSPLAGGDLTLQTANYEHSVDAVSDAQGRFSFSGLTAGDYVLSAVVPGIGTVRYGESSDPSWTSTIHLGTNGQNKILMFPVVPRAAIEGVVRDEFGDPMMYATVVLLRPIWRDGKATTATVSQKATDDRGRYRFSSLVPGSYLICTSGRGNGATAPVEGPVDFAAHADNRYYVRSCYPAASGTSPRTFSLTPGQSAQVDLTPLAAPAATIRGHVRNLPSQSGFSVFLGPDDTSDAMRPGGFGAVIDPAQAAFTIRGVPPGHYRLRADFRPNVQGPNGGPEPLFADIPIDVGGSNIDGLDLSLEPGAVLDVAIHGIAENSLDPNNVGVTLRRGDGTRASRGAPRAKDGTSHFDGLSAGRYWLATRVNGEACVVSAMLGDRDVLTSAFEVGRGAASRIDITVSRSCHTLYARVVRDGDALPGARVILLRSGTPKDPGDLVEEVANDEGQISFSGLPPGKYLLWAWIPDVRGGFAGPESLAAVEKQATAVEIKDGPPAQVDVPVLKAGGNL